MVMPQKWILINYDEENVKQRIWLGTTYAFSALTFFLSSFKAVFRGGAFAQGFTGIKTGEIVGWVIVFYAPVDAVLVFLVLVIGSYYSGGDWILMSGGGALLLSPLLMYVFRDTIVNANSNEYEWRSRMKILRTFLFVVTNIGYIMLGIWVLQNEVTTYSEICSTVIFELGSFLLTSVLVTDVFYSIEKNDSGEKSFLAEEEGINLRPSASVEVVETCLD